MMGLTKIISLFVFLLNVTAAQAADTAVLLPLSIQIQATRDIAAESSDKNIFTVKVDTKAAASSELRDILFYVDGRFEAEFKDQALPFSFKRNLRGQAVGRHEFRVDIVDASNPEKVLGRDSVVVEVTR